MRALAVEIDENWIEAMQYLNMEPVKNVAATKNNAQRRQMISNLLRDSL